MLGRNPGLIGASAAECALLLCGCEHKFPGKVTELALADSGLRLPVGDACAQRYESSRAIGHTHFGSVPWTIFDPGASEHADGSRSVRPVATTDEVARIIKQRDFNTHPLKHGANS